MLELILSIEGVLLIIGFFIFLFTAIMATVENDRDMAILSVKALFISVTWPYYLIRGTKKYGEVLWNR